MVRVTLTVFLGLEYEICKLFITYAKRIVNIYLYRDTFLLPTAPATVHL